MGISKKIKLYIKGLLLFPYYIIKIDKRSKSIENMTNKIVNMENNLSILKNDTHIIFKYISGLELHPKTHERIIIDDYRDAYNDHLIRYTKACEYINKNDIVLDFACGCGYGSSCIKINANPKELLGCDIDNASIEFANRFYSKQGIVFKTMNVVNPNNFDENTFDKIVSFETIEHVPNEISKKVISNFYSWLKIGGRIICSVPNETLLPFDKSKNHFHFRHYTSEQFKVYLESAGFKNITLMYFNDKTGQFFDSCVESCFESIVAIAEK